MRNSLADDKLRTSVGLSGNGMTRPHLIRTVDLTELSAALDLLLVQSPATEATEQKARWEQGLAAGELERAGLFVAPGPYGLLGAVWLQVQPGRYALLTPPAFAADAPPTVAEALLLRSLDYAREAGVELVQALLPADAGAQGSFLLQNGFIELAELVYLVALSQGFPSAMPPGDWSCRRVLPRDLPQLTALIERTYEGSLDCPGMLGRRSAADAVAGYAAVGSSGMDHWYLVEEAGQAVGCLLMADHPADGPRELVYLGLVPEVRGRGWGEQLSRFAQWTCRAAGKELLVLAVDAANSPAVDAYERAGFTRWETRRVFVRNLNSSWPS